MTNYYKNLQLENLNKLKYYTINLKAITLNAQPL